MYQICIKLGHYNGDVGKGSIINDEIKVEKVENDIIITVKKEYVENDNGARKVINKTINMIEFFEYHYISWSHFEGIINTLMEKELYIEPSNPIASASIVSILIDKDKEIKITEIKHNLFFKLKDVLLGFYNMPIEILEKL